MKASEILHGLAELLAGIERSQGELQQPQPTEHAPLLTTVTVSNADDSEKTTMVPPLQQKMELLKKSLNVDNEFDQGFDQIDQEQENEEQGDDDLERMKKMAGIKQIAQQELAHDDPADQ